MSEHVRETAEEEAGRAIADSIIDALETSTLGLASAIRSVREEQARNRTDIHALIQRVDDLEQIVHARTDRLG